MTDRQSIKDILRPYIPRFLVEAYRSSRRLFALAHALLLFPVNGVRCLAVTRDFLPTRTERGRQNRRLHGYDYSLLPNRYIETSERESLSLEQATRNNGLSIGYPAWNLLYYSVLCSLPGRDEQTAVVVETGTNMGFSTIVLAQALKDSGVEGCVYTVDIDGQMVEIARQNVDKAGLTEYVEFHAQDSLSFLKNLVHEVDYINFAFLDGSHEYEHVRREFAAIYPRIVACRGKVYFDNTIAAGVAEGLHFIKHAYSGHMIEFRNCSWSPPGNVIWQPNW